MPVKITKEDELLLEKYGRAVSKRSNHLIYGNAVLISLIPIWLFWRVHSLTLVSNAVLYTIVSVASALLMSYAYSSSKTPLMERIASRRTDAITKEVNSVYGKDKKLSRKDRDDAIRERTTEVADYESTTFAIFYNNCLFLLILLVTSLVLSQFSPQLNYFVSMLLAGGSAAFLSSGKSSI
ncbi:Translocon-associated complex TRAP gamma subunit [Fasciola hepatica]|uniref:Translocon-associated protein subunit gamma n=1 Tax=Fasciola hepatica TaxID=6192 RepID=A0A2H1C3M8_FASHE|nr:Translocon-associated complex TRAP gamma subunit [Fasciola hepatica]